MKMVGLSEILISPPSLNLTQKKPEPDRGLRDFLRLALLAQLTQALKKQLVITQPKYFIGTLRNFSKSSWGKTTGERSGRGTWRYKPSDPFFCILGLVVVACFL
jgi:hypothetical protein